MARTKRQVKPSIRAPLTDRQKELMLAILLRNEEAFLAVKDLLTVEAFAESDMGYEAVWHVANNFFAEHGCLPDNESIVTEIDAAVQNKAIEMADYPAHQERIGKLLAFAYDDDEWPESPKTHHPFRDQAIKMARYFMEEYLARKMQASIMYGQSVTADLPSLLEDWSQKVHALSVMRPAASDELFPENWEDADPVIIRPSGLDMIDPFTGGHANGEVYLIMGPFGSCKTTLSHMIGAEMAKAEMEATSTHGNDGKIGVSFIVNYETPLRETRERLLGYICKIPRTTFEERSKKLSKFSTSQTLKDYEKRAHRDAIVGGQNVPGEQERIDAAMTWLGQHLHVFDFSGASNAGGGGVPEIVQGINQVLRQRNAYCAGISIDYVGFMVRRFMDRSNIDSSQLRHHLLSAMVQINHRLARPLDCPVYVFHQLSGEANKYGATKKLDYTMAAECKSLAENAHFSLEITKPDHNNLATIGCSKHRRRPPRDRLVIKIAGETHRVVNVDDKYTIDTNSRQILTRDDQNRLPAEALQYAAQFVTQEESNESADVFGDMNLETNG